MEDNTFSYPSLFWAQPIFVSYLFLPWRPRQFIRYFDAATISSHGEQTHWIRGSSLSIVAA
jgi:hypothetical protein